MVILNHVTDNIWFVKHNGNPSLDIFVIEMLAGCAVPLFLMLTGAFLIDGLRDKNPKDFYIKSFKKIGIPSIIFIFIYWAVEYGLRTTPFIKSLLKGFPGHPLWYVFMLAGIYFLLPLVSLLKFNLGNKLYVKYCLVYFAWMTLSRYADASITTWSIGGVFNYFGYVLLGDVINAYIKQNEKNNKKGILLFVLANAILVLDGIILYYQALNGGEYYNNLLNGYEAPLVIISIILIFTSFAYMQIRENTLIIKISSLSFIVYLTHKLVIDLSPRAPIYGYICSLNTITCIVAYFIFVLFVSLVLAFIYQTVKKRLKL